MSFGFSVGDFLAVGNLVLEIKAALQNVGGARSDYQELVRELDTLQKALQHLDTLQQRGSTGSLHLDSIKFAALSCRQPLEDFLKKVRKYGRSLDIQAKGGAFKATGDKLRWAFGKKDEIQKLQNYLNLHVGTINMLLTEHGLASMTVAAEKAEVDNLQIRERLDQAHGLIRCIKGNVVAQKLIVQNTLTMLSRLCETINGEFKTSWTSLCEMVSKVW